MAASRLIKLFGTEDQAESGARVACGPLSLTVEQGRLRHIRFLGIEAIRSIDYLVRDANWGTPAAKLSPATIEQDEDGFRITQHGRIEADGINYSYRMDVEGHVIGLEVTVVGEAHLSFLTNRTGFTVLHSIAGVAGQPVDIIHADGSLETGRFPSLISPGQPIFSIRSLRHQVAKGLFVTCRMEASLPGRPDTVFEMEDQRNWTDASYKTYIGSLLDPWPYRIEAGQTLRQRISLQLEGTAASAGTDSSSTITIAIGNEPRGSMPDIGIGMMPDHLAEIEASADLIEILQPAFLTAYVDAGSIDLKKTFFAYQTTAEQMNAALQLELVLPEGRSPREALQRAGEIAAEVNLTPERVLPCPAPYLKSIQPSGPWPDVADLAYVMNQTRAAFPQSRVLGGMISYFTELNRKPPPAACIDGISCTTTPIVHAADDVSVMETLEALPFVVESMKAMAPGLPVHIGPSSIAMRHNPYGASTVANPMHRRLAMADCDPRQRGLFGATWTVGYAAALARAGATTLALHYLCGPSGVIPSNDRPNLPWFAKEEAAQVFPLFHVMRCLCQASAAKLLPIETGSPAVAGLAWLEDRTPRLLVANLGPTPLDLDLPQGLHGQILDEDSFEAACATPQWLDDGSRPLAIPERLKAYAVLFATG